ncbi:MAG: Bug family tripartite tricarboxylate transporter substrate binding protein [Burkholderiales bacterium]
MHDHTRRIYLHPYGYPKALVKLVAALAIFLTFANPNARAQSYPDRPIRFAVSYAPGGPADILARLIGQKLSERLGQQILVENRPGGGGNIAAVAVARAAPDGYTLFMMTSTQAANMTLYAKPGYDVMKDFAHITNIVAYPTLLVVNPKNPWRTLAEFIAHAKANPGRLTYGSAGTGGGAHVSGETLKAMAGIDVVHVPYKGQAPALVDVMSGQIDATFVGVSASLPHINAGKIRPLGITSKERLRAVPDIPTIAEAGVPGYEVVSWLGMSVPAGTPGTIVQRLNTEMVRIIEEPEFAERLRRDGGEPVVSSTERFTSYVQSEVVRWGQMIRDAAIKPE